MFLIDAIKHNVEKKLKLVLFLYATVLGRVVASLQNKSSFASFRVRFSGDNKDFIQNKRKNIIIKVMGCNKIE